MASQRQDDGGDEADGDVQEEEDEAGLRDCTEVLLTDVLRSCGWRK